MPGKRPRGPLAFYDFPEVDKKRISSTNGQERLNMEIRRRSRVVGCSPRSKATSGLTICYLIEYAKDWIVYSDVRNLA